LNRPRLGIGGQAPHPKVGAISMVPGAASTPASTGGGGPAQAVAIAGLLRAQCESCPAARGPMAIAYISE
jgi:hypothetical protein